MSRSYFCHEPWTGNFSVRINGDVVVCPCYAKVVIGNIDESDLTALWNAPTLVEMRKSFQSGTLPEVCREQICPVVIGKAGELKERWERRQRTLDRRE